MGQQTRRRYNSPRRSQQAEITRQAIVQAARRLFAEHGYQATTLQAIAREADVSAPTLYTTFGSKAAILSALVRSAGADEAIRAVAVAAFAEPDPRRQLHLAARVIRSIHERDADIVDLMWQAGAGERDLAAAWRQSHQQQLARQGELLELLAHKEALRPGLATGTATEIHWAVSSPEVYRLLVRERGWTPQEYEDWLGDTMAILLLRGS